MELVLELVLELILELILKLISDPDGCPLTVGISKLIRGREWWHRLKLSQMTVTIT